jgi:hypothetical protein
MDNNSSTFKKLNQIFLSMSGYVNNNNSGQRQTIEQPRETMPEIVKGASPEELYQKVLDREQAKSLKNSYIKYEKSNIHRMMQYEAARLPAYIDYEGMEYYPLIASALDLIAEEACTMGDDGKMLRIYSKSSRIKSLLEDLFFGILNVNTNLPFWARNLIKYGDNFILLYPEKGLGVKAVKQMYNFDIERKETVVDDEYKILFKHRSSGEEFNMFQIAHFRLLGDDKLLPYGTSILNKIRRVFRQLILAEDSMLTYRILRAGDKRVFKVDVGNMDPNDVEEYVDMVSNLLKKTPQVNRNDGNIDYRFNIVTNDEDLFIPIRNANSGNVVENLNGVTNFNEIQDIQYLRDNLFTGLGIPKPFLSFQSSAGDGKNMAQFDMRFALKVNRIQQAIIQELNKIAVIHLYMLGFTDELENFTLELTNPSTQLELLKIELLKEKSQLYSEITRADDNGIAPVSHTWAKRNIMGFSDEEIVQDLKNQKMERVINQELQDAITVIPKSGIFKDMDLKYGVPNMDAPDRTEGDEETPDAGEEVVNVESTPQEESVKRKRYDDLIVELVYGSPKEKPEKKSTEIINKNRLLHEKVTKLLKENIDDK